MKPETLCDSEWKLMDLLWDLGPTPSGQLARLALERLGWKKSTTYTQLKRLGEKGLLKNESALVTPLLSRAEAQGQESRRTVQKAFHGSLPSFVAAFLGGAAPLSPQEAQELKALIDRYQEENHG